MSSSFSKGFLRQHAPEINLVHRLMDPFAATLAFFLSAHHPETIWTPIDILFLPIVFLLTVVVFRHFDLYRPWRGTTLFAESRRVLGAWAVVLCLLAPLGYLAPSPATFSENFFILFALVTPILLVIIRLAFRLTLRELRKHGKNLRRVVIAGAGHLGQRVATQIRNDAGIGIQLHGFFDDQAVEGLTHVGDVPVLGALQDLPNYVKKHAIDMIYLALPFRAEMKMRKIANEIKETRASLYLVPDIFIFSLLNARILDLGDIPIFSLFSSPITGIDSWAKRLQDVVLGTIIGVLLSPLLLIIAILIRLTSGRPVLFAQRRYGLHGEEVKVYKFRTMKVCEDGPEMTQATRNDPRITLLGAFLRRTSLDELPQLINVLKGDMSLVGPRPHPLALNEHYRCLIDDYMVRHKVKPGITGWAQINGWRGETETLEKMQKRVEFDLEYIQNWSIWLDLKILFLTVFRGLTGTNAY